MEPYPYPMNSGEGTIASMVAITVFVLVSILVIVLLESAVQTESSPNAMTVTPYDPLDPSPTGIVATTWFVPGSIRERCRCRRRHWHAPTPHRTRPRR